MEAYLETCLLCSFFGYGFLMAIAVFAIYARALEVRHHNLNFDSIVSKNVS